MLGKPMRKEIKKLMRNGEVLSFQKVDAKKKVMSIWSSCFVEENNVIIRGQYNNNSLEKTLVMAIDGNNKELIGEKLYQRIFLTKGIGVTSNQRNVYSILQVRYKNSNFLLTSGNSPYIDIFKMQDILSKKKSSKIKQWN